jgi:tetratricopeptide (TPR) repeat protein
MPGNKRAYTGAMKKASSAAWDRRWSTAISEYRRALREFPRDPAGHAGLALALKECGQLEDALVEYRVARELLPNDPVPVAQTAALHEKLGHAEEAANDYLELAELYVSLKQGTKAIETWRQAATLIPKRLDVHEKLFTAYQDAGNNPAAAQELTVLASGQREAGDIPRAQILLQQALSIDPQNHQALTLKAELVGNASSPVSDAGDNPMERVRRSSLSRLAQTVFEGGARWRRTVPAVELATHVDVEGLLAAAIDAQTHGKTAEAIDKYEQIVREGQAGPGVEFNLALLYKDTWRYADAILLLNKTADDPQFAAASYFAMGECCRAQGKPDLALENFIQAMKACDLSTAERGQADQVIGVYESLAESYRTKGLDENAEKYIQTLVDFLTGKGWEDKVREVRRHLVSVGEAGAIVNFAEILELPESDRVIESLALAIDYAKQGHLVAATDEVMTAVELAPDYLPVHQRLAEFLVQSGRIQEASEKYDALADAALARGEFPNAVSFYRQTVALAPEDLTRRAKLIDLLLGHGLLLDALNEYVELGGLLERSGQSQKAVDEYAEAINLAERAGAVGPPVSALRSRLADAYLKNGQWSDALAAFQAIRADFPEDERAQFFMVELSLRMGLRAQGERELDDMLGRCAKAPKKRRAIIMALTRSLPDDIPLNLLLAHAYVAEGHSEKAVESLDALGERLLNAGDREGAMQVIREIVALNPPLVDDYRKVLDQLRASS